MKKSLLITLLVLLGFLSFGQYPITQNLGSTSTIVQVPGTGALRASLVNRTFADTTAANATPIDFYPAALIFTTGDNTLWVRNASATAWVEISTGSSLAPNLQQVTDVGSVTTNDITLTNADLFLSNTTTASPEGIIYKNGVPWMHDFTPAGWSGGLTKRNLFFG